MRVYNLYGRRDNKYKARIKILVHEIGAEKFRAEVEAEYAKRPRQETRGRRSASWRASPLISHRRQFERLPRWSPKFEEARSPIRLSHAGSAPMWRRISSTAIRSSISRSSPKAAFRAMRRPTRCELVADLAERTVSAMNSVSAIAQNLVLPHVKRDDAFRRVAGPRSR